MKNIVLTRIDDRLLHGQVVISWVPWLKVREIVVIDEDYSKDEFLREIVRESAPEGIAVKVLSSEEGSAYLKSDDGLSPVLVLCRQVEAIAALVKKGVSIDRLNIGSLGRIKGRNRYADYVYLSDREAEMLRFVQQKGTEVELRMLPADKPQRLNLSLPHFCNRIAME